ncbi:MAG: YdcF family protein, partial [Bacteroidota bacterium]
MKKRLRLLAITLLSLLLLFVGTAISIRQYSKRFSTSQSDVAIVLGAGTSNGKLSPVYAQRVNHALDLLSAGKVDKVIFTGGFGEGERISDAEAAAAYAIEKGFSEDQILIEEESTITFYNIKNAKALMKDHDLKNALIVSDPYHMKRAMHMCQKIGIKALSSPTPTTMYRSRKTKFDFLVKETINYWAYIL